MDAANASSPMLNTVETVAESKCLQYDRQIQNFQELIGVLRSKNRHNNHLIGVAERNIERLMLKKEAALQKETQAYN